MIKEKNLKALKECRPELYSLIQNTKLTGRYKLIPSLNPQKIPNLQDTLTGKLYYDNADPVGGSKRFIEEKKNNLPAVAMFIGMGLMYNVMNYANMYIANDSCYMIVEKDPEIFALVAEYIDLEPYIRDRRMNFLIGKDINGLYPVMSTIINTGNIKFYAKAINYIEEPAAFAADKEYYINSVRTLGEAVKQTIKFYGNDPLDSLIGIDHTFVNINEIIEYPGISDLRDKFRGKPGIIVATGPSLNKNVHLLKGLEDKAVICAVDASVRVMKKHGFKPHLTTSLERVEATSKLFEGLEEDDFKDIYLAACPVIHPLTYENFKGERIVVFRNFATFQWLDMPKGTLDIGPSSANMSFKVLEYLGCDPIILIGQDLAFGENDLTHASGSTYGEKEDQYHTKIHNLVVEGNYVPEIKTTEVWETFRRFYMKDVASFNGRVINATEGGAKIPGTILMTFAEAIEKFIGSVPPSDITKTIRESLHKPNQTEITALYKKIAEKVSRSITYSENAMKRMYDGYLAMTEYEEKVLKPYLLNGAYDWEKAKSFLQRLDKANSVFNDEEFFHILMHYVQSYYIRTMIEINGVRAADIPIPEKNNAIAMLSKDMHAVMVELIKKMLSMMHVLKELTETNYKKISEQ